MKFKGLLTFVTYNGLSLIGKQMVEDFKNVTDPVYPEMIVFEKGKRPNFAANFNSVYQAYKDKGKFEVVHPGSKQATQSIYGDFSVDSDYRKRLEALKEDVKSEIEKDEKLQSLLKLETWDDPRMLEYWQFRVTKIIAEKEKQHGFVYKSPPSVFKYNSRDLNNLDKEFDCEHFAITYGLIHSMINDEYGLRQPPADDEPIKDYKITGNFYYVTCDTPQGGHALIYSPYTSGFIDQGYYSLPMSPKLDDMDYRNTGNNNLPIYTFEDFKKGEGLNIFTGNETYDDMSFNRTGDRFIGYVDQYIYEGKIFSPVVKEALFFPAASLLKDGSTAEVRVQIANQLVRNYMQEVKIIDEKDQVITPKEFGWVVNYLEHDIKKQLFAGEFEKDFSKVDFANIFRPENTECLTVTIDGKEIDISPVKGCENKNNLPIQAKKKQEGVEH